LYVCHQRQGHITYATKEKDTKDKFHPLYVTQEKEKKDQFHALYAAIDLDSELSALSSLLLWMNHLISVGCKLRCAANGGEHDLVVQATK
jgi:hypothetical protein